MALFARVDQARAGVTDYAQRSAAERELARAAAQRAREARLESVEAAFYDTAMELVRKAEEEERAAQSHLDAAREYDRLAAEPQGSVTATATRAEPAAEAGVGREERRGLGRWQRRGRESGDRSSREAASSDTAGHEHERVSETELEEVSVDEQRARFFDYSRDMLCTAGFDGYFKLVNEAWERTLGYTRDEMLSRPYMDFVHPADIERTTAEAASLGTAGVDTVQFRNRYRAKDGSYRWLEWNSRADRGAELIYAVARDVTDQQRAAEAEARLSAIVRSSADGIIGLSPQGTITSWNAGAERLYGYTMDEIVGEPLSTLIPPERAGEDRMLLDRVLAGETIDHFETERQRKDGTRFTASVSMAQVLDDQDRVVGASISVREIKPRAG
jgi:PAS domain S-box-containing protein